MIEDQRRADGKLVECRFGEEVLLDDPESGLVGAREPVEGGDRVVVPLRVPALTVDREVSVTLQEQDQVGGQQLRQPDAGDGAEATVLGRPEPGEQLEVCLAALELELGADVAEEHGCAPNGSEGGDVSVDAAVDRLGQAVRREGAAQGHKHLAVALPLGVCQGGQGEGNDRGQEHQAFHESSTCYCPIFGT